MKMIKVRIDYTDGEYSAVEYTDEHARVSLAFVEMGEDEWLAWRVHVVHARLWHALLGKLDNLQFFQRRTSNVHTQNKDGQ